MSNSPNMAFRICECYVRDRISGRKLDEDLIPKILGFLRSKDIARLATCSDLVSVEQCHAGTWVTLRQVEAFFKKNADFSDPEGTERAALDSFIAAEQNCSSTNAFLDKLFFDPSEDLMVWGQLEKMRMFIHHLLGDFGPFLDNIPGLVKVTSGATATSPRKKSLPHLKLRLRMYGPRRARPFIDALYRYFGFKGPRWRNDSSNRVVFVPKNWKTKRTIACEPVGSLPLQLAFDTWAKMLLARRWGIDLSDQSRNQQLAREGSEDGSLATLDLSAASDTLSYNLVAWVLPTPWFEFLDGLRCTHGSLPDGSQVKYEKFSSMGNGATFSLETLIFAAACKAVGSNRFSVYGDDIIVERELVPALTALLAAIGFTVNKEKSFSTGPYRESCGEHYFQGMEITPFYLRSWPHMENRAPRGSDLSMLCHNVNGLAKISTPEGEWELLRQFVQLYRLPLVPFSESTVAGILVPATQAYALSLIRTSHGISRYRGFQAKVRLRDVSYSYQAYILWHLRASQRKSEVESELICSRAPTSATKYTRRWVYWLPPVAVTPPHLYWWGDYLTR